MKSCIYCNAEPRQVSDFLFYLEVLPSRVECCFTVPPFVWFPAIFLCLPVSCLSISPCVYSVCAPCCLCQFPWASSCVFLCLPVACFWFLFLALFLVFLLICTLILFVLCSTLCVVTLYFWYLLIFFFLCFLFFIFCILYHYFRESSELFLILPAKHHKSLCSLLKQRCI